MEKTKIEISIVIPVYESEAMLGELCDRLTKCLQQMSKRYEILLINDASPDNSWNKIKEIAAINNSVKGVALSRNFGQHNAITAGLDLASGDWIVVMDCDLQDRPEEIPRFFEKAKEGYDIIVGKRIRRKDSVLNILTSKMFYILFNYLTDQSIDNSISSFGMYSKRVIDNIKNLRESTRSFGRFAFWVGFRRTEIEIEHCSRKAGNSGYNLRKRVNLALDSILAYSNKPLKLTIKIGFLISFFSFTYSIWLIIRYFKYSVFVTGWTSLIVSLYFLSGLIISIIGIVGLYIGKIFDEVKNRPLYIIESTTFIEYPGPHGRR